MQVYENGIYREITQEEENEINKNYIKEKVVELKQQLSNTDYKAIKYAEGWISEEEYAPIKAQRQEIRDKINELENNYSSDGWGV